MAFIGGAPAPNGERAPARVTKRDIARAFGLKGEAKAGLKLLIKDLQAEGTVARGRKALTSRAACRRWSSPTFPSATAKAN